MALPKRRKEPKPYPRRYFPSRRMRKQMVPWFRPDILIRTGIDLFRSWVIDSQIDTRELQVVAEMESARHAGRRNEFEEVRAYDFNGIVPRGKKPSRARPARDAAFYFDFLADTGDGWDATYSVASLLSRDRLRVRKEEYSEEFLHLPRGSFVLIGGDLVYPTASDDSYRNRFARPFTYAWDWMWMRTHSSPRAGGGPEREEGRLLGPKAEPRVYAIPGNHDWYDSLSAFRARFCNLSNPREIGFWKTDQSRSYFALRLPEDWHILALDIGLSRHLDNEQFNYFANVIRQMDSGSRLILVCAEPDWVYGGVQDNKVYRTLEMFESLILDIFESEKGKEPPRIYLNLAGDIHNYQRYERLSLEGIEDELNKLLRGRYAHLADRRDQIMERIRSNYHSRQKIVSGGGGAFLHPTHAEVRRNMKVIPSWSERSGREVNEEQAEVSVEDLYECRSRYPDSLLSRILAFGAAIRFLFNNKSLAATIGLAYTAIGRTLESLTDGHLREQLIQSPVATIVTHIDITAVFAFATIILVFTIWPASNARSRTLRIAGFVHGLVQATIAFGGFFLLHHILYVSDYEIASAAPALTRVLLFLGQFCFAALVGSWAMAWAFWGYLRFFRAAHNDAFAHASIAGFKNFLRLKIEPGGKLTIYPIAVPEPVPFSHPEDSELDVEKWNVGGLELGGRRVTNKSRLSKAEAAELKARVDWKRTTSYSAPGEAPLRAQRISCHLIEEPVTIDPDSPAG